MRLEQVMTWSVEAEACLPAASAQLVRLSLNEPADYVRGGQETYRFDLGLTPRPNNARACYRDRWGPHRFEKIGDVLLLPPGETVQTKSDAIALQRSLVCHLRPEPMRDWFDGDLHWTDQGLVAALDVRDTNIRSLLLRLAAELKEPGLASDMFLSLIAGQLAIEIGRYCAAASSNVARGGLAAWRLRLIDERLREVRVPPSLPELARLCGVSVRALTRGFRDSRGMSIGDHVAQSQLEHARRMLACGEGVKSVALALGFRSTASFCHAFRRRSGETPGQFRERTLRERRLDS